MISFLLLYIVFRDRAFQFLIGVFRVECLFTIEYGKERKTAKITQNKVKFALDNNLYGILTDNLIEKGAEKFV